MGNAARRKPTHPPQPGNEELARYTPELEAMASAHGLDYFPVDFELVPNTFMMEVAVYGLPVRMPHWSFGVRYIYQYVQHRMGGSRIFEVVFPGDPNRAYLVADNALAENTLVTAHVLGHADFSKKNALFQRMQKRVGYHIVEQAAERAHTIEAAIRQHGPKRVEAVLDAALALEQHVDVNQPLERPLYPKYVKIPIPERKTGFRARFSHLPGEGHETPDTEPKRSPIPPYPEYDLLWFIARYGPELEPWEKDIFLGVREESFYFYPVFACQIMNEGWASYWHARLLREADFLPHQLYLDAIKAHSDVIRPYSDENSLALNINPYHVGFAMWERIVRDLGLDAALRIRAEEDDFSFVRNYLDEDLVSELKLFGYSRSSEHIKINDWDMNQLREQLLAPKFNFAAPRISVSSLDTDGSLELVHDYATDGRGLDAERAQRVLEYIHRVWRRPVRLVTANESGDELMLEKD